jgi:S-(hydroxymethyl)glutathione dehydrogenase / alcohol dehydrogenase
LELQKRQDFKMIKYPIKFKAAILEKINSPLIIDEVEFAGPLEAGQVLTKIYYSGICGKQIDEITGKGFDGRGKDPYIPHMLGHEGAGIVIDVGPGVKKVIPGDNVVLHWLKGSGIDSSTPLYHNNGRRINAGCITTFNEYGIISENRMTVIPKGSDLEKACLFGCCITTGVGVILNDAKVLPEDSVLIYGCGGVGLSAIQGASLIHANPIVGVDINKESLELAKKFGATHTIRGDLEDVLESVKKITKHNGAEHVSVTIGNPKAIETAINCGSSPGTIYFVGVPPYESNITINPFEVHTSRILQGSSGGGCFPDRDIPKYLQLYERGFINARDLISKVIKLKDINKGIQATISGKIGRCVVKME